ncbi:MAG: DUF2782 domain-containing protein [Methylococcus sp.]|nr:DUF2782 domain-containing protein [Methylococcus sp.]
MTDTSTTAMPFPIRRLPLLLLLLAPLAWGIDSPEEGKLQPVPDPPDIPGPVQSGEELEPDVTIMRKGDDLYEEYRINGKLYMVKVKPKIGPPYVLMDKDGDGNMDVRTTDLARSMDVPQWVLFSW